MKRSLFLSLLLLSPLFARENPFFAADESKVKKVTSNIPDSKPQMSTVSYALPDEARILKEVIFTVQNVDGSIESHKILIDQSIDWHRSINLSQSLNGTSSRSSAGIKSASSADFGFIRFDAKGRYLSIKTTAPLARHFVLSDPNRIVLDFKHEAIFKTEEKKFNAGSYLGVSLGNHGKFARATITLDGRYGYELSKAGDFITITCK